MKNYKEITLRYLKGQKNRSLLTIFGIILSVALITAIGTMIVSARGALITQAIRNEGSYHGSIINIDEKTLSKLNNHEDIENLGIYAFEGSAPIVKTTKEEQSDYGYKIKNRYIEIDSHDEKSMEMLSINLKEGRLPKNSDEIIIEYWMTDYFQEDIEIGDKINLKLGNREIDPLSMEESLELTGEKEYTVVGFIQPNFVWKGNLVTQGITAFDTESTYDKYSSYFTLNDIDGAYSKISSIAEELDVIDENIGYNNKLLRLSAESVSDTFNESIIGLFIFIVAIIMISTIAVIYNSFNISVIERISQFGILRSIGATPNQIKGIILREAALLSGIGIPIGLFSGVFAMRLVLYIISLIQSDIALFSDMNIIISLQVFMISTVLGLVTVFLSALGPAILAGKVS